MRDPELLRLARVQDEYPDYRLARRGYRNFTADPPEGEGETLTASSPELLEVKLHAERFRPLTSDCKYLRPPADGRPGRA